MYYLSLTLKAEFIGLSMILRIGILAASSRNLETWLLLSDGATYVVILYREDEYLH